MMYFMCEISWFPLHPYTKFVFHAHRILITFVIIYKYNTEVCSKIMKSYSHYFLMILQIMMNV